MQAYLTQAATCCCSPIYDERVPLLIDYQGDGRLWNFPGSRSPGDQHLTRAAVGLVYLPDYERGGSRGRPVRKVEPAQEQPGA